MDGRHENLVEEALRAHEAIVQAVHATTESCWLDLDLTITQLKGLFVLADNAPVTVGGLAEMLGIGRPAASILVDNLVGLGLAERAEDAADRRRTIVRPSPTGCELVAALQHGGRQHMRDWFGRLAADDLAALVRGLTALAAAARDTPVTGAAPSLTTPGTTTAAR